MSLYIVNAADIYFFFCWFGGLLASPFWFLWFFFSSLLYKEKNDSLLKPEEEKHGVVYWRSLPIFLIVLCFFFVSSMSIVHHLFSILSFDCHFYSLNKLNKVCKGKICALAAINLQYIFPYPPLIWNGLSIHIWNMIW